MLKIKFGANDSNLYKKVIPFTHADDRITAIIGLRSPIQSVMLEIKKICLEIENGKTLINDPKRAYIFESVKSQLPLGIPEVKLHTTSTKNIMKLIEFSMQASQENAEKFRMIQRIIGFTTEARLHEIVQCYDEEEWNDY